MMSAVGTHRPLLAVRVLSDDPLASLGVAEVRELTAGDWLALQEDLSGDDSENRRSMQILARSLHINGSPIGWDTLMGVGMSSVGAALEAMNEVMGAGASGN